VAFAFAAHAESKLSCPPAFRTARDKTDGLCRFHHVSVHRPEFHPLDVGAGKQLVPHRSSYRHQHLSDGHHPTAHRSPADIDARVTQQGYALPKQWAVVAIFVHHRVDITPSEQALVDDLMGRVAAVTPCSDMICMPASRAWSLNEIPRRLNIQHFADFVANHGGLSAAVAAYALLRLQATPFHTEDRGRPRTARGRYHLRDRKLPPP